MSNTDTPSTEPTDWPADWPQPPAAWNPTPAETGGLDLKATITIDQGGEVLTYPFEWIGKDPDTENSWDWWDGERMHGVPQPPHPEGDTWVWGDGAVIVSTPTEA